MVPEAGVDAPTTAIITETGPPILVPVPMQLGSAIGRGLETPPTVSDHAVLSIIVANWHMPDAGFDINQRRCVCHVPLQRCTFHLCWTTVTANAIISQVRVITNSVRRHLI